MKERSLRRRGLWLMDCIFTRVAAKKAASVPLTVDAMRFTCASRKVLLVLKAAGGGAYGPHLHKGGHQGGRQCAALGLHD